MIRGRVVRAGTLIVDGEVVVGVMVEATMDELKNNRLVLYKNVEVREIGTPQTIIRDYKP
jgi:hypothetical protein